MTEEQPIRVEERYTGHQLGFPILFHDMPISKFMGREFAQVDWEEIQKTAFSALIIKPALLSGNEVKFMRTFMELSIEDLARGMKLPPEVIALWEMKEDKPTGMSKGLEAVFRIFSSKDDRVGSHSKGFATDMLLDTLVTLVDGAEVIMHVELQKGRTFMVYFLPTIYP